MNIEVKEKKINKVYPSNFIEIQNRIIKRIDKIKF